MKNSLLPGGEQVLVVSRQKAIHRVVDLLALDSEGNLVIIEVKNEKSTRTVIGQSLEYLAQYEGGTLDDLADDWAESVDGQTLTEAFAATFGKECRELGKGRRVYIIAPAFDPHSAVCTGYLSNRLKQAGVKFQLLVANTTGNGFSLNCYEPPAFEWTRYLKGRFGTSASGRIFYVIQGDPSPIIWSVGKLEKDGSLRIPGGPAITKRSLRRFRRLLMPRDSLPHCDLSSHGSVWVRRDRPRQFAKVIGRVAKEPQDLSDGGYVIIARFLDASFLYFQKKEWRRFQAEWRSIRKSLPDWPEILSAARQKLGR